MTEFEILTKLHGSPLLAELVVERRRIQSAMRPAKASKASTAPAVKPRLWGRMASLERRIAEVEKLVSELPPSQITHIKKTIKGSDADCAERSDHTPKWPAIFQIQKTVALHYDVTHLELMSKRREVRISRARWVSMYLCRVLTPRTFTEIGRAFFNRDHTTIMEACRNAAYRIKSDPELAKEIEALRLQIADSMRD